MAILQSYDLKGNKLSFANWISNLSPTDTPFVSMTGKESVEQTLFQWQTDVLSAIKDNAVVEGSDAVDPTLTATTVNDNFTQILRKTVKVSDSANSLVNYGRGRELAYQMEKVGKEIKRDLELLFLSAQTKNAGSATTVRKTSGFKALVAAKGVADPSTGAIVHKDTGTDPAKLSEKLLFDMSYNLYLAGSKADTIMFHPKHALFFADLIEKSETGRVKMFEGSDTTFVNFVNTINDPLGQKYKLVPNRFMPTDHLYFFQASDWTQMVFRAPERTELAKTGSAEKWMIEMEVGLRHRNPYASGILVLQQSAPFDGETLISEEAPEPKAKKAKAPKAE